jgi:hypothetical protein
LSQALSGVTEANAENPCFPSEGFFGSLHDSGDLATGVQTFECAFSSMTLSFVFDAPCPTAFFFGMNSLRSSVGGCPAVY